MLLSGLLSSVFTPLLVAFIAALCTWGLLHALLPYLRRLLLDQPNHRSSHLHPTPRGGGSAFVLVAVVASSLNLLLAFLQDRTPNFASFLSLLVFPLAIVSFLDDRFSLPAILRYVVQLATASILILLSPLPLPWISAPIALIAVTAVINFVNFMDGLDGLATGCMAVVLFSAFLYSNVPWPLWAVFGALAGFLPWNWSPATVFMGDVGSTFLGAVFAGLVLQQHTWPDVVGVLLLATPLLADASSCVVRRLFAGQSVFQPHRLHLYQRLHQAGWSHSRVSSVYIASTAALAFSLLCAGWYQIVGVSVVELMVGIWLDQHVAVPFSVAIAKAHAHHMVVSD